ncbi:MAG: ATP-binding protein [Deltaproteobacteria bacterium]|nr:ATP-binding protein [Deltaproteobacteria bacterium]
MIRDRMLGDINPRQGKVLEKVVLRSKDLLSMITSILQASSIEGGAIKVDRKGFDLNHFLDELKSIYDVPLGKELTLVWDYPRGLPFVTTDSEKLKCILQNLINNAIKFTDRGQVTVSARYLSESGKVGFEVADTGIGISQEALPAIFEMFRQVDGSETRAHGGVGLGLYIVKRLAKLLGGKVEVESEFGKGSAFTVTISSQN